MEKLGLLGTGFAQQHYNIIGLRSELKSYRPPIRSIRKEMEVNEKVFEVLKG